MRIFQRNPPASLRDIAACEEAINAMLPPSYKDYLLQHDGVTFDIDDNLLSFSNADCPYGDLAMNSVIGVTRHYSERTLIEHLEAWVDLFPISMVPVALDSCGIYLLVDCEGESIWIFNPDLTGEWGEPGDYPTGYKCDQLFGVRGIFRANGDGS